jgi:hypothetical protein
MLAGEGLGIGVYAKWAQAFAAAGYSGAIVPFPGHLDDDVVDANGGIDSSSAGEVLSQYLHSVIEDSGWTPPLLIAHSLGSYAALQYVFCYTIVLPSFPVCDVSVSLIHLLQPACIF